ncbi:MAG: TolC family protein [Elusimicrobiota bacterium]
MTGLVALALRHTQLLGSQEARSEQMRFSAAQARVWPGLSLDFSAGRKREESHAGPLYEASIAQPLPLAGRPGLRSERLDLESQGWRVRREASGAAVTLDVVRLAYEYALNRRKAVFVEKRRKRFELIQSYMKGRVFASPQRKAESRIVQNRLKSLVSEALQSQAAFQAPLEKLRAYVPLEPGSHPEIQVPWLMGTRSLEDEAWMTKTLENNPDIRLHRLSVKTAEVEKSLASRDAWPEPSIIASYEQSTAAETEKSLGLGLGLALPSWNGNRAGIKSAERRAVAEERLLGFQKQRLAGEIAKALIEYEAARQAVLQYPQTYLPELEAQLEEVEAGFRKGQVDLLTFLELDGAAFEAVDNMLESQLALMSEIGEVLRLSGERDILNRIDSF